ncbi:MAG: glycosyltransferase [Gemmatimonadaceae bacterium]
MGEQGRDVPNEARPLSVLVLSPIYPWAGNPAEGVFVHRQVRNLARLGVQVRVLSYHGGLRGLPATALGCTWLRHHPRWLGWPRQLDEIPVDHTFYPRERNKTVDVIPALGDALLRFIDSHSEYHETDLVYAHWLWTGGACALRLRREFGWPVAAIARGSDLNHWLTAHRYCRRHVQHVLNAADLVLANCNALRQRAEALCPVSSPNVEVVYNGCDPQTFQPATNRSDVRLALGLPLDSRLLLCCASLSALKGIRELANAWSLFAPGHPDWRLVVVGPCVQRSVRSHLRRMGLRRTLVVGQISPDRVPLYMQAADAYVQPSLLEGLANATMEAMASGLPVIATNTGGQSEVVRDGENGWLVPPGDAHALARALDAMASDPVEAQRRAGAARLTIRVDFDSMVHARHLRSLLQNLVNRRSEAAFRHHRIAL